MLYRVLAATIFLLSLTVFSGSARADWKPPVDCNGLGEPSGFDCGDLSYEGCCDETGRLLWCDGGALYCIDCAGLNPLCGWSPDAGFYDCGTVGDPEPSGTFPLTCGPVCDPACLPGEACQDGVCVPCTPDCTGKMCGSDGCGGSCGTCAPGEQCQGFMCQPAGNGGCEPSDTPGCGGCACEGCVCAMDAFCCDTMWDSICVDECQTQCGGCGGGEVCGNGQCGVGEDCASCPLDCPCAPGQNCQNGVCVGGGGDGGCVPTEFPGCGGCACEACVCAMDPFCCDTMWDSLCVDECQTQCGGCGGGNPGGDGCTPSQTPGCGGCACEACVCGLDPFCCQTAWDDLCVGECQNDCGGCGGGNQDCGNGMCEANLGENCESCALDCGCAPNQICQQGVCINDTGAGCEPTEFPGCGGCACEACVCALDSYCCETAWDGICVGECQEQCGGCGGGGETCGDGMCAANMGEDCSTCPQDCGCPPGQNCQFGMCVGGGGEDGCEPLEHPGCGGCACEACVCGLDPYCCETAWDSLCVGECEQDCGGCGASEYCGDGNCQQGNGENCQTCPADCGCVDGQECISGTCCTPNCAGVQCGDDGCGGSCGECDFGFCVEGQCLTGLGCAVTDEPGCDNCLCELCVCQKDAYCCETAWDEACVELCVNQCAGCEELPDCGDGLCDAEALEDCGTCPQDCGCDGALTCINGNCAVDFCELGVDAMGCCMGSIHIVCLGHDIVISDCGDQGGVCGWFPGNQQLDPGFYCGPEGVVDPAGDPDGIYEMECPECPASCDGKECGGDGCGGSCGDCPEGDDCEAGVCVTCQPNCAGKNCGPDGCGGVCGDCPAPDSCEQGVCVACQPDCLGKQCGDDGCLGVCGECAEEEICEGGFCKCMPDCDGKECGPDGCNGTCGMCPGALLCTNGICTDCTPDCTGKECGGNGCGGDCGECPAGFSCDDTICVPDCIADCDGKECGPNGCDGFCGECPEDFYCFEGVCVDDCDAACDGKQCGGDGCGGDCGECGKGEECQENQCVVSCVPDCADAVCGDDGCGNSCGECDPGYGCVDGLCEESSTIPEDVTAQDSTGGGIVVDTPSDDSSGCSTSPRGSASVVWLLLAIGFALLGLRRRKLASRI